VVIVSNRSIDDIAGRVNVPGVILGGCNGIEWQLPSGYRMGAFRDYEDDLIHVRTKIVSELYEIISGQGFEIEDKLWSIAIHGGKDSHSAWRNVTKNVSQWAKKCGLTCYCGDDQIDVQLIQKFNKSAGISYLTRLFNINQSSDSIFYVGHDESDAVALWWTMLFGGTSIVVGKKLSISGTVYAKDSSHLAAMMVGLLLRHENS
jgi:trehalose 6-phosphate phosphatase